MAAKTRNEIDTQVDAVFQPTIEAVELRNFLKDDLNDSLLLRKDVIAAETPAAGVVTVNFADKDLATISTAVNLSISFTGLENGDVKYIHVTKNATNTVSFTGATDVSARKNQINTVETVVQYQVRQKNSIITVESINIDNDVSDNENSYIKVVEIGPWNMDDAGTALILGFPSGVAYSKVVGIESILIQNDAQTQKVPLTHVESSFGTNTPDQGGYVTSTLGLVLINNLGGQFDSTTYNDTGINRGWVTLRLIP